MEWELNAPTHRLLHVHKYCFPLANVGKSHSTQLKVSDNILQCRTTYQRLLHNLNVVPMATTDRDAWFVNPPDF